MPDETREKPSSTSSMESFRRPYEPLPMESVLKMFRQAQELVDEGILKPKPVDPNWRLKP